MLGSLRKFARRNKVGLVMVATVTFALLAGTIISTWQAFRATSAEELAGERLLAEYAARREAEINLGKAREAVDRMLTRVAEERLINVPWMESTRKALLEDAVQFYEQLLAERNTDPDTRLATAKAHAKLGWVHARFFETSAEQAAYRRAVDLLEPLVKEFPHEFRYRSALANVLYLQSNSIAWNRQRWQEAEQLLRRAIELQESAATATPDSAQSMYELARMLHLMGCALHTGNQPEQAVTAWQQALTVSERITAEQPNHPAHLSLQIRALDNVANVLKKKDQRRAEELLLRAQALAGRFQALPDFKVVFDESARAISDVDIALGRLYQGQGRFVEAEAAYRRGVAILEKYAVDYPGVRLYQSWLANALDKLGWFLLADHRAAEAELVFRRAWQFGAELLHDRLIQNGTLAEWSLTGLDGLGHALREQGRPQEALQLYGQTAKLLDKIQAEFPDSPNAWPTLAKAYKALGDSLTNADERSLTVEAYEQAIQIYSKLLADFPARAELQSQLDSTLQALARRYYSVGNSLVRQEKSG